MKRILCMGSVNIDLVMYMEHAPLPGETVVTDNFATFPGGKGGNQAATAAALGAEVRYFTKLGDDLFSSQLTDELKARGVDMSSVQYLSGETAGIAMIRVDKHGQNSISFTSGANGKLTAKDVEENEAVFEGCQILLLTMEIAPETVYAAIKLGKRKGMTVVLDPAPAPERGIPPEIARLVDYVKPNETEAEILCGVPVADMQSAAQALKALQLCGFQAPIITLAGSGALTVLNGEPYTVEPVRVKSVDSTAAGDIFLGAFTAALARGDAFADCLDYAKTAAAISTTRQGAQTSIPTREEVLCALR